MNKASNGNRIHELADALADEHPDITVSEIRQAMDGREPYSRVFYELAEWKRLRSAPPSRVDAPVLEDVEQTLKSVMQLIWRAGAVEARAELQRLRAQAQEEAAELRRDLADAVQEVTRLEGDLGFHTRKLDEISATLQKTEAALSARDTEVNALRQHAADLSSQQRGLIDRIERLATRAAAAETALRNARQNVPPSHDAPDATNGISH